MSQAVDYKTHVLIGVRADDTMAVLCHWHHLPKQAEVAEMTKTARDAYVQLILCTPTSVWQATP